MSFSGKTVLRAALLLVLAALLAFIWGSSLRSSEASHHQSEAALQTLSPAVEAFMGKSPITEPQLRKMAHFSEFAALGALLVLIWAAFCPVSPQTVFNSLSLGLFAAVADESLQILSSRGSQVSDILLDFSGVCAGVVFSLLLLFTVKAVRRRQR